MVNIVLSNGVDLPLIGMGTWKITDRETMKEVIAAGYRHGYRLIDTAAAYSNEIAIAKAIESLGISRQELLITDKVWNTNRGYEEVQQACRKSLKKLKTDYLDLYLIHWPASKQLHQDWKTINAETWRGMERLYHDGLVRAIGVCNFKDYHLEELKKGAEVIPHINQVECHPGLGQKELRQYCQSNGIVVEASSPLGNGEILQNDQICSVGAVHNKSAAQICIRWGIQKGMIIIPKTIKEERLQQNLDVFDFVLTEQEMDIIDQIPFCGGLGIDSDEVTEFG